MSVTDNNAIAENECTFYDVKDVGEFLKGSPFNIIHVNIRSCNKNLDEFLLYLQQISITISVIILSETWLSSVHELIDIPGYAGFHSIREGRRGRRCQHFC